MHKHPEIGFELPATLDFVKNKLIEYGLESVEIGNHGLTALIGKEGGKTILLRADRKALPITEDSGLEFASE